MLLYLKKLRDKQSLVKADIKKEIKNLDIEFHSVSRLNNLTQNYLSLEHDINIVLDLISKNV